MPSRVLYFVGSFEQGGSERQMSELLAHVPRARVEAHVAVCHAQDDYGYRLPIASFTDLRAPRLPMLRTIQALADLIGRLRPDVVHAVHDPENSYARVAARLAGARCAVIGSLRCTQLPQRTLRRERLTRRWGHAIVVNSRGIRDELRARAGIDDAVVIENGVDCARFAPLERPMLERQRARWRMSGPTFVVPARISAQKNQLSVLRAVAHLRRRGLWPAGARVILAGRVETGTRYAALVDRATWWFGLGGVVERIDPVRDAESLLGAADAVLLPSRFEGLPNAVLESMACGTPAIVSPAANVDGLVRDALTGFVADPDARGVARGLLRLLRTTADERMAMGSRARADVRERFTVERMVAATCDLYDRVVS